MKSWPGWALVAAGQLIAPSPRQIVGAQRSLEPAEIAAVLAASREAIAGQTLTLTYSDRNEGPQILMRGDGRPARMRTAYGVSGGTVGRDGSRSEWHDDFIDIVNYTGTPAVRCDDTTVAGELVITYEHRASTDTWTTQAATTAVNWQGTPAEIGKPIFDILAGRIPLSSEIIRHSGDGRLTRAFTAPFSTPADSSDDQRLGDSTATATQSLWIDTESFLPVRWEVAIGGIVGYELVFKYEALDLRPPEGLIAPHCIP